MKNRSLFWHTCLAGACLVMAYVAWTHPNITDADDAVVLLPGDKSLLTGLTWEDSDTRVGVMRVGPDAEADAEAGKGSPDKGGTQVSVTKISPPEPPEVFPGSEAAKQLLDSMVPLLAARDLGPPDANQRAAFGLDAPKIKLTLHFGAREAAVQLGNTTFGSGDYYVRGPANHAYLLRAATVSALGHGAMRLQDRDVVGVPRGKFNRMVINQGGKEKIFVQRHPEIQAEAFFAEAAEPDSKLETVPPWVDKFLRLRVTGFVDAPPPQEAALAVTLFWDKTQVATLRIWPGQKEKDGGVVVTPRFKKPVVVAKSAIDTLLQDVAGLF